MSNPIKSRPILSATFSTLANEDSARLQEALQEIASQDPTIEINPQPLEEGVVVAARNKSDLDAIGDRLLDEYNLQANVSDYRVIYVETIRKSAEAEGKYIRQTGSSGNYGHCKLRIEPNTRGMGYEFVDETKGGVIPKEYILPIEQGVQRASELGILAGHPIVDVKVTLLDGSYHEVDSNEMAFKFAGSTAFKEAARKASPAVMEPVMAIEAKVPEELAEAYIGEINSHGGRIQRIEDIDGWRMIMALVPLAKLLNSKSQKLSEMPMKFAAYEAVPSGGWFGGAEPGVPVILPKTPKRGAGSTAVRLEPDTQ